MSSPTIIDLDNITQEDQVMVCIGPVGAGKSMFIDLLANQEGRRAINSLEGGTTKVEATRIQYDSGTSVVLIDTPGFDSNSPVEADMMKKVIEPLRRLHERNVKIAGFMYLHDISTSAYECLLPKALKVLKKLYRDIVMKRTMIIWNACAKVEESERHLREEQFTQTFSPMITQGLRFSRLERLTATLAWQVIAPLISSESEAVAIADCVWLQNTMYSIDPAIERQRLKFLNDLRKILETLENGEARKVLEAAFERFEAQYRREGCCVNERSATTLDIEPKVTFRQHVKELVCPCFFM